MQTRFSIDALDNIFAQGFDARMMASMPGFWKLYYEAAAEKTDYRPKDPAVLRQNMVDTKARLVSTFEPASNQYAQDYGVAGMCLVSRRGRRGRQAGRDRGSQAYRLRARRERRRFHPQSHLRAGYL